MMANYFLSPSSSSSWGRMGRKKKREGGRKGGRWKWIVHCHVPPINGQRDSRIRQGRRRKREGGKGEQGREDGFSATPVRHLFGPDGKDTDDSEIKAIPGGRRSRRSICERVSHARMFVLRSMARGKRTENWHLYRKRDVT